MVEIPLTKGDWGSLDEDIARARAHNIYLTENPYAPEQTCRVSRPSLNEFAVFGDGPIYGLWHQDGALNGDWFVVSGERLYRFTPPATIVDLGEIPGTEYPDFSGDKGRVVIVRNGAIWNTDGVTITPIPMPDNELVGSVAFINGAILVSVLDGDKDYWILPGEVGPDPLDFVTDERSPDAIVAQATLGDEIWVLGQSGCNVFQDTGDADARFQRIPGRAYPFGCAARSTVCSAVLGQYSCLIWVSDEGQVVLAQGAPNRISTRSEEELLKRSTNLRAWTFRANREDFYILTSDQQTLAYCINRNEWYRWSSYEFNHFRAHLGLQTGRDVYAGDSEQGRIWKLGTDISDAGEFIVRECMGFIPNIESVSQPCYRVNARINVGWSPEYKTIPNFELRFSDDGGFTWTGWWQEPVGDKGKYSTDVTFLSLGSFDRPGRLFHFRFSHIASFRIDYATMNET